MSKSISVILLLFVLVNSGCVRYSQLLGYQSGEENLPKSYDTDDYKLRPNDLLDVKLYEPNDPSMMSLDELGGNQPMQIQVNPALFYLKGYRVNDSGYVVLPKLKPIKAEGYSVEELEKIINKEYGKLSNYGYYRIKLSNMKISVVGEVTRPGTQYIYDSRFTLAQAIANAGHFTEVANLKRVIVIRESSNKPIVLDFTTTDFLSSPAYFLQPNDLVYVEPLKAKAFRANAQAVSVTLSAISVFMVVINLLINASR